MMTRDCWNDRFSLKCFKSSIAMAQQEETKYFPILVEARIYRRKKQK